MKMPARLYPRHLGTCGVCCAACSAYLNAKNPCPGCRAPAAQHTRKSCAFCSKKSCAQAQGLTWCFECAKHPCAKINNLAKRYRQNYHVDIIQNGADAAGDMPALLTAMRQRFTCAVCGGIIDQHHQCCSECGAVIQNK